MIREGACREIGTGSDLSAHAPHYSGAEPSSGDPSKVSPEDPSFLWFNYNAEAAASFYVSIFRDSKILNRMGQSGGQDGSGGGVPAREDRDSGAA